MFRKFLIFLSFLFLVSNVFSGSPEMVLKSGVLTASDEFKISDDLMYKSPFTFGGFYSDHIIDIAEDTSGNVYAVGYLFDTISFGDVSLSVTEEESCVFITKFDSLGSVQWVKCIRGTGTLSEHNVAADDLGNVYVTLNFNGNLWFDSFSFTSQGKSDVLVASFDSSGEVRLMKQLGDNLDDFNGGVALDRSGCVYVPVTNFNSSSLGSDFSIIKLDQSGEVQLVMRFLGNPAIWCTDIVSDGDNLYFAGTLNGSTVFRADVLTLVGEQDVFVANLSLSSGVVQWAKRFGGDCSDGCCGLAVNDCGDLYVAGYFHGAMDDFPLTSVGEQDAFVTNLSCTSGEVQWIRGLGGSSPDSCFGITTDCSGMVWVIGDFGLPVTFDNFSFLSPFPLDDEFLIGLDSLSGSVVSVESKILSSDSFLGEIKAPH